MRKFLRRFVKPIGISAEARKKVVETVADGATATRRFYLLLALSTTIAAFGLLSNSAAVIIGAMIVAPLMGPILGLSLGMICGNRRLERDSLFAEVTGVALAIAFGYAAGHFPLNLGVSDEMLARTSPTAYDLIIAFVSGLAGGYASVNPKVNTTFAGVSIAVALVPPLATCGLLLAMGNPSAGLGAFLLFLANFFAIQVASALVFVLFGLGRRDDGVPPEWRQVMIRFAPGTIALALMGWYMTGVLVQMTRDRSDEQAIRSTLARQIAGRTGGRLERILRHSQANGAYQIVASALTPSVFRADQVRQIEAALSQTLGAPVSLVLRSVVSQDIDHSGRVYLNDEEKRQSERASEEATSLQRTRATLAAALESIRGAYLADLERSEQDGVSVITATVQGPTELSPGDVEALQREVATGLGSQIRLIVRNVQTHDVDAGGYLYEPQPAAAPPDPRATSNQARVESVLRDRMRRKTARFLTSVSLHSEGSKLVVEATVEATLPVRPAEVAEIESDLRKYVDPAIALSMRTVFATHATGGGWRP